MCPPFLGSLLYHLLGRTLQPGEEGHCSVLSRAGTLQGLTRLLCPQSQSQLLPRGSEGHMGCRAWELGLHAHTHSL